MTTVHEPILKIGKFGVHILSTPNSKFAFFGNVPVGCAGTFATYDEAMSSFVAFFISQTTDWQREHVGNLRNDVFEIIFTL